MTKIVITAGQNFIDIDILACAIAYNELLIKEGKDSVAILPGELNKSVTDTIKKWEPPYLKKCSYTDPNFVVVDISQPEHLANFVKVEKISELFDHHFGFEKVWHQLTKGRIVIEAVGACATLIWEQFKKRNQSEKISTLSANLLCYAIVSNTLNFKAFVTDERDRAAFKEILQYAKLPTNWIESYFKEQEKLVFLNPEKEIINDTQVEKFPKSEEKLIIGQIELWDSRKFIDEHKIDIRKALESFGAQNWFLTSPSISEGKNYIYTESKKVQNLLTKYLDLEFNDNLATTRKLYLRKEIKKILYNY